MYENKFLATSLYKHLDEGRFVFECILAGNLQAFTTCRFNSISTVVETISIAVKINF